MGEWREEGVIFRIGTVAGIFGALLAMVGNLLHPATPIGNPEGVARTIAESETWVPVHLVIVVGLILMLGGLVAISRSIEGGVPGALARLGSVAAVAGVTVGVVLLRGFCSCPWCPSCTQRVNRPRRRSRSPLFL